MTDFETRAADWLEFHEARGRILAAAGALGSESVSLADALGRALASEVRSLWALPPWDNSAMDGYAVRGTDIEGARKNDPVELRVIDRVMAGESTDFTLERGQAVRIMTGGPVPNGADTIVRVEHTDAEEETSGRVRIFEDSDRGRHIRPGGQDWEADQVALRTGTTVTPGAVGVLAAAGATSVEVVRRPGVAVLPTGDELFDIESEREPEGPPGAIPESNSHMVAAQVAAAGGLPRRLAIARDDDSALENAIRDAEASDVLVTIGGASMGEGDRVKRVLDDLGYRQDFWRARIRPGSPVSFGRLPRDDGELWVFGLPGNPASAFVTFEIFVRPFLRKLAGHTEPVRPTLRARAAEPLRTAEHLTHFLRVRVSVTEDGPRAHLSGPQGSGLVSSLGTTNGLAVVPVGVRTVDVGEPVDVIPLD